MAANTWDKRSRTEALKAAGLSEDAQQAMTGVFDAMTSWRDEIAKAADRNGSVVFDRMGNAAKAMGWPAELVDMTRQQMQAGSKMQLQMMDQVMDIWEKQVRDPGSPIGTMPGMPQMPQFENPFAAFMPGGGAMPNGMPGMPDFSTMANPMQFWMQAAEMWQKNWATAMQSMLDIQKSALNKAAKGPFG